MRKFVKAAPVLIAFALLSVMVCFFGCTKDDIQNQAQKLSETAAKAAVLRFKAAKYIHSLCQAKKIHIISRAGSRGSIYGKRGIYGQQNDGFKFI